MGGIVGSASRSETVPEWIAQNTEGHWHCVDCELPALDWRLVWHYTDCDAEFRWRMGRLDERLAESKDVPATP